MLFKVSAKLITVLFRFLFFSRKRFHKYAPPIPNLFEQQQRLLHDLSDHHLAGEDFNNVAHKNVGRDLNYHVKNFLDNYDGRLRLHKCLFQYNRETIELETFIPTLTDVNSENISPYLSA